jgi:hypothetical protein
LTLNRLHGFIPQKRELYPTAAVIISDPLRMLRMMAEWEQILLEHV